MDELRALRIKFDAHAKNFKDWSRSGGPINAIWARETDELGRELHRAQRRAARRVFEAEREAEARCLGAFQVYRKRRRAGELLAQRQQRQNRTPSPSSSQQGERRYGDGPTPMAETEEEDPLQLELMACAEVGRFERLGDRDIGFVCDFCDGYIVWEDLQSVPTARTICTAAGAAAARDHQHLRNTSASSVATTVRSSLGSSYFSKRPSSALASILPTITSMPSPIPITPGGPGPGVGGRTPLPTRQTSVTPPPASSPAAVVDPSAVTDIGNYAEHWEATGVSATSGEERTVVFAPLVVASHMPPRPAGVGGMGLDRGFGRDSRDGDDAQFDGTRWKARLLCHYCDALTYENPGDGEVEISKYVQDDGGFPDLNALQRHLERYHTSLAAGVVEAGRTATCVVM